MQFRQQVLFHPFNDQITTGTIRVVARSLCTVCLDKRVGEIIVLRNMLHILRHANYLFNNNEYFIRMEF